MNLTRIVRKDKSPSLYGSNFGRAPSKELFCKGSNDPKITDCVSLTELSGADDIWSMCSQRPLADRALPWNPYVSLKNNSLGDDTINNIDWRRGRGCGGGGRERALGKAKVWRE